MKRQLWKLEWKDEMSVGIPAIDDDHKQFISSIVELNQAIAQRMRPAEIHSRLQAIVEDTKGHFGREEQYFLDWQYPDAAGHARIHAHILKSLQAILDSFLPYGLEAEWTDAAQVVKDMLISHILVEDMKYAHYLHARDAGAAPPEKQAGGSAKPAEASRTGTQSSRTESSQQNRH